MNMASLRYRKNRPSRPWIVSWREDGKPRTASFPTEEQAQRYLDACNTPAGRPPPGSVSAAVDRWDKEERPLLSDPESPKAHAERIKSLLGDLPVSSLGEGDYRKLATHYRTSDLKAKPGTIQNGLSLLRRVCTAAGHPPPRGVVGRIVGQVRRTVAEETSRDAFSHEEVATLLELAEEYEKHLYGPLLFAFQAGPRRGEIWGLDWDAVELHRGRVHIRKQKLHTGQEKLPKWGKTRYTPLAPEIAGWLEAEAARQGRERPWTDPGPVFLAPGGVRWDADEFKKAWKRLRNRAAAKKVRPLTFHCTRHTFVTWGLESGVPVTQVARWVGDRPETILRHYSHVLDGIEPDMGFVRLAKPEQVRKVH